MKKDDKPKELIYPGATAKKILSGNTPTSNEISGNHARMIKLLTNISEKFDKILLKLEQLENVMNVDEIILYNTVQYLKDRKIIDDEDYNQYITDAYEGMENAVTENDEENEEESSEETINEGK
jgi:hypothetical protein